jgi:hypothetical protein
LTFYQNVSSCLAFNLAALLLSIFTCILQLITMVTAKIIAIEKNAAENIIGKWYLVINVLFCSCKGKEEILTFVSRLIGVAFSS